MRHIELTREVQLSLAVWTAEVARAKRAYYADSEPPKPTRQRGKAVGVCERCGIDSTQLSAEKCPPCKNYLWRRANRDMRARKCPTCERSHTRPGQICGSCSARAYRERSKA